MLARVSLEIKPSVRVCSITDALSIVGDRYALLIVREVRYGRTRFSQLAISTGAPRDVLSARLRKLERAGIVERHLYSERPPRYEYVLTQPGHELLPILLTLKEWGDRHINPGAEPIVFEHRCGAEFHAVTVCEACREPVGYDDELTVVGGTHAAQAEM